eukprot:TRINITY_DN13921_c0_g1_i1.p1 TRINITY_DN13921_c0_g1~~TRINITY_DN13921_c0_g1_i1.p1  ORF type:complete len:327 (-),score=90.13 TRINITY_DN13921_c0_g1_i1:35-1015(-)
MEGVEEVYIGVDGGGTKTSVAVISVERSKRDRSLLAHTVLSSCTVGGTNQNSVGKQKAKETLCDGVRSAIDLAGLSPTQVKGVCCCMSGVDRREDKELVKGWLAEVVDPESTKLLIYSDAVGALASGTGGQLRGIVLIAGTGMIVMGFADSETRARVSGWGPLMGDIGSGYWLGHMALRACAQAADGASGPTSILPKVLAKVGAEVPEELIPWTYQDTRWDRIAALAQCVLEAVREGDAVASALIEEAVSEYVKCISTVYHRLHLGRETPATIVLSGGLLTHKNSVLAAELQKAMASTALNHKITLPTMPPEEASAILVYRAVHDM